MTRTFMRAGNKGRGALVASLVVSACVVLSGCTMNQATKGGIAGGALGSGLGAIIGNQSGNTGAGIAIGAAAGTLGGALIGNALDNQDRANEQLSGQMAQNQQQLEENARLIEELKKRGADVRSSRRGVVINLPDILFEFDRDRLTPEARRTINEISDVIRDVPHRDLSVEGHTDSIGSMRYNKDLSLRRAQSVARELQSHSVPSQRMKIEGFGEGAPIATNNSEEGRARNRRVEVIIENQKAY